MRPTLRQLRWLETLIELSKVFAGDGRFMIGLAKLGTAKDLGEPKLKYGILIGPLACN